MTFWDLVAARAAGDPDAVVVADDSGASLTAAELHDGAEALAFRLAGRGVQPGDCVSWVLPSSVESVVLLCALARLGAVQNPIVPILPPEDVAAITSQVGAALVVDEAVLASLTHGPAVDVPLPAEEDTVRWLFPTSGTTATPKVVKHSDRTMLAAGAAMRPTGLRAGSRWGGAIPITHVGGPSMLALALSIGMSMHFVQRFHPVRTCEQFRDWGCDVVVGIGAVVTALFEFPERLPALRVLLSGGGPKQPGVAERVRDELGAELIPSYGLTECPYVAVSAPDDPPHALSEGEGRPRSGVEVRIAGGEEGEVRVRGPQLFLGYVDSSLDVDAFDEDGFFRTGDIGYLAPEGHLVITGRLKEVVVRNGENVSVRPIEDALVQHPAVAEAVVVGLPDPVIGERVTAVVVARSLVTLEELQRFCAERGLPKRKWPERLELVESIPRNALGKPLKRKLLGALA